MNMKMGSDEISKNSALFYQLVASFSTSAWQHLGKIADPMTGKVAKDLKLASYYIDILCMLKEKTKGNLSQEEEQATERTLGDLQLNYIEEAGKEETSEKDENNSTAESASEGDKQSD